MAPRGRSTGRNTTDPALGWHHQQARDRLRAALIAGTPCWWCGHPMYRHQDLHADHSVPRSQGGAIADRLLHASCNMSRGNGSRDHRRPALAASADGRRIPRSRDW